MICLTGARFSMKADILKQGATTGTTSFGTWVGNQDPLTKEIVNTWVPDNAGTLAVDESVLSTFKCIARGIVDGGIRVAGTTERFGEEYHNVDFVKLWTPPNVLITKRDRITNIRQRNGTKVWIDEEAETSKATVYNVNGVTPLFDAFNRHVENYVMLERAEI